MKRKIGLLTMPILDNYGGIIQIAALYHIIEKYGFQPVLINKRYNQSKVKTILKFLIENNPFYNFYDYNNSVTRKKNLIKITSFIDSYFVNKSKPLYNQKDVENFSKNVDAVIVGSDQVWRYAYVKNNYKHYFLNFVDDKTDKIAYAASFGVDYWEGNEKTVTDVKSLLKNFKAVGVREDIGEVICKNTFDYDNAKQVLDPTLLPNIDFYNSLIAKEKISKKVSLFNYVLDRSEAKQNIVKNIASKKGLEINVIGLSNNIKNEIKPSLAEWLYHFKNSDFVVTDSFHGTVFSIIFNKQFIAIGNKTRGIARFTSLLNIFGLESRLVFEEELNSLDNIIENKIDYSSVNEILSKEREKSLNFLLESLK